MDPTAEHNPQSPRKWAVPRGLRTVRAKYDYDYPSFMEGVIRAISLLLRV